MNKKKLTSDEKDFLVKNRNRYYVGELAKILCRNDGTIYRFFQKAGLNYKQRFSSNPDELTQQELNVLKLFAYTRVEIGKKMMIEQCTVATYTNNIFNKFHLPTNNRGAAIIYALKNGILQIEDFELSD